MNNLTNKQIQEILDGAPEGATHYVTRNRKYFKRDGNTDNIYLWLRVNESWVMLESKNRWLERLERLREILALRQEVERLKAQQSELAATVERLRDTLQNYTAEKACCGQGEIQYSSEGEPIGQECCGKPDIDWPDDVTALLAATPSQNLNAVKREAYTEGFVQGYNLGYEVFALGFNKPANEIEVTNIGADKAAQRYPDKE